MAVRAKENLRTEEMRFIDFTAVEVGWAFDAKITQSASYSITITADDKIFDNIQVLKTGDTVKIGLKPGVSKGFNSMLSKVRRVEITMPELYKLDLSGATRGTVKGFRSSHTLVLGLSGASLLGMVDMLVGDIEISLSGASNLKAKGEAKNLRVSASGASQMDFSDFPLHNAYINLSGASRATVNLDGVLDANISGVSRLKYLGKPTMRNIQTSGLSTISKK